MGAIHTLGKGSDGNHRLVFHFAVPSGNNDVPVAAGGPVTWQEAVVASLGGSPTSVLPDGDGTKGTISSEELAQIVSGEVLERQYTYVVDSGGTTDSERAVSIRAFYAAKKTQVTAEVVVQLSYFGAVLTEA